MNTFESLGYTEAAKAIAAGMEAAQRFGRPMAFAVMDHAGDMIASSRMEGVPARVLRTAIRKAHTAAKMGRNTLSLKRDLDDRLNTLWDWGDKEFTTLQGGLVVKRPDVEGAGERVLGAIACGGGTLETDEEVARMMVRAIGLEPVLDERLLVPWKPASKISTTGRCSFALPLAASALPPGQAAPGATRIGNVVHTTGVFGCDPKSGELPSDPEAQFANAFTNLQRVLEMAGVSSADEIGLITYFIPDASYRKFINKPWMRYFPGTVRPERKTNQIPLPPGVVVQLQAVALIGEKASPLEIPGLWHRDPLPMGARIGDQLYSSVISGQDPDNGGRMVKDPVAQIACVFDNARRLMEQAGSTLDQINHVWVFMQPHFPWHDQMVEAWVRTFADPASRPARKTVPYDGLSGDNHIQIQITATLAGGKRSNLEVEHVHHIDPIPLGSRVGRFLYSSGIGGLDPEKGRQWVKPEIHSTAAFMVDGLEAQTRLSLMHLDTLMKNDGATLDNVAALTVLVRRFEDVPVIAEHLRRSFPDAQSQPAVQYIHYRLPDHVLVQLHAVGVRA